MLLVLVKTTLDQLNKEILVEMDPSGGLFAYGGGGGGGAGGAGGASPGHLPRKWWSMVV